MSMLCKMHKILILPNIIKEPILVGVYDENCKLCRDFALTKPLSDALVPTFVELQRQEIEFDELYFVRGPGSFMALKLLYLFAKTLEIARDVKLFATHAFYFNGNSPIKAYGNCYFVCENVNRIDIDNEIYVKKFMEAPQVLPFVLPEELDVSIFNANLKPLYLLPPV